MDLLLEEFKKLNEDRKKDMKRIQVIARGLNLQTDVSLRAQMSVERGEAEYTKAIHLRTVEDIHAWLRSKGLNAPKELIDRRLLPRNLGTW